jgi:hypothetical protein
MDAKIKEKSQEESKKVQKENLAKAEVKPEVARSGKKGIKIKPWVLLLFIDLLMLLVSVFFIVSLPKKAAELNKLRSDEQKVKESKNIDVTGLEYKPTKENVDKLESFYPEEGGLIDFIEMVEQLKKNGQVKNFSLVDQYAVKDKTGAFGIPFIIEFEGSWDNINVSLQEFQKLPYLIRAITIEAKVVDENVVNFKYGGFLYVSDKLAKTR